MTIFGKEKNEYKYKNHSGKVLIEYPLGEKYVWH